MTTSGQQEFSDEDDSYPSSEEQLEVNAGQSFGIGSIRSSGGTLSGTGVIELRSVPRSEGRKVAAVDELSESDEEFSQ